MVEGGSFGTFNQTASLSGATRRVNYAFNVLPFSHRPDTGDAARSAAAGPPDQRRYDNCTYSTKLGVTTDPTTSRSMWVGRYTDATAAFHRRRFLCFPLTCQMRPEHPG